MYLTGGRKIANNFVAMTEESFKTDIEGLIDALNRRNQELWRVIRRRKNYQRFKNLWNSNAESQKFFELYCEERKELGLEAEEAHFDKLWQFHNALHKSLKVSLSEWAEMLVQ